MMQLKQHSHRLLKRSSSDFSAHEVPPGDTPYVLAKRVQLVDKDLDRAILLFRAAISQGDRVDSALKDMAMLMKQQNRAAEAIEAINSLRNRCSNQAQVSLDNILLDLYKRCGRLEDQIALLKHKLRLIDQGVVFNGKCTKTARSQGRKFKVTVEQEAARLLGNLGWALMLKENYQEAEAVYRGALIIKPDDNKLCNLVICLMQQGCIAEAKEILMQVRSQFISTDSDMFKQAQEMLRKLEARNTANWSFDAILGQSSAAIWQPHPCTDSVAPLPMSQFVKLKRKLSTKDLHTGVWMEVERRSIGNQYQDLRNVDEFYASLIASMLCPLLDDETTTQSSLATPEGKKRRIFEDITASLKISI